MQFQTLTILSLALAAAATPLVARQDTGDCQAKYQTCIAAGTPEVACSCTLAACAGEDDARNREFCATATANLGVATSIPGGCNPAHPGSCPTPSAAVPVPVATSIPGGCNPAHPGSCPTPSAAVPVPVATSIPGGCNPAHPGSCPTPTSIPGGCNPAHPGSCPTPTKAAGSSTAKASPPAFTGAASANGVSVAMLALGALALF